MSWQAIQFLIKIINSVENYVSLDAPVATYVNRRLSWADVKGAVHYRVLKNGKEISRTTQPLFAVTNENYGEYQVIAIDAKGVESFGSEPVLVAAKNLVRVFEVENVSERSKEKYLGFSGDGFVEISKSKSTTINIPVTISADGTYLINFKYANGNGPVNTENKCAIRTLKADSKAIGTIVMPQRGKDEWSNWGWSNSVSTPLTAGKHTITVSFDSDNENMNGEVNQAMIDYMRVIKKL